MISDRYLELTRRFDQLFTRKQLFWLYIVGVLTFFGYQAAPVLQFRGARDVTPLVSGSPAYEQWWSAVARDSTEYKENSASRVIPINLLLDARCSPAGRFGSGGCRLLVRWDSVVLMSGLTFMAGLLLLFAPRTTFESERERSPGRTEGDSLRTGEESDTRPGDGMINPARREASQETRDHDRAPQHAAQDDSDIPRVAPEPALVPQLSIENGYGTPGVLSDFFSRYLTPTPRARIYHVLESDVRDARARADHLYARSNTLLWVGVSMALLGVAVFWVSLPRTFPAPAAGAPNYDFLNAIRPIGILIFIEGVAFFLLRQYRALIEDYKSLHKLYLRRSNLSIAFEAADEFKDEQRRSALMLLIGAALTDDLSGRLDTGQTTENLEGLRAIESNPVFGLIQQLISRFPSGVGGDNAEPATPKK